MNENYEFFWIYSAYFFSIIFFVIGYVNNYQNYIYYAFFFLSIGLSMVISAKLNKILSILDEEEEFTFYEDSD